MEGNPVNENQPKPVFEQGEVYIVGLLSGERYEGKCTDYDGAWVNLYDRYGGPLSVDLRCDAIVMVNHITLP